MTTLVPITAGVAIISGHDVSKEPDQVRGMIGVIPQALTSDPDLTWFDVTDLPDPLVPGVRMHIHAGQKAVAG